MYKNDSYSREDETGQTNQGRLWKDHAVRMIEKDYPPWERLTEMDYFRHGESASYRSRESSSYEQERIGSREDKGGSERLKENRSRMREDYSRPRARGRRDSSGDMSSERSRSRSWEDEKHWERRSGAGERSAGSRQRLQRNDNGRRRSDFYDRGGERRERKKMESVNEEEHFHLGETDTCFNNNRIYSRKRKPGRDLERIAVRRASSVEGYKWGGIKKRKRFVEEVIMSGKEAGVETEVSLESKVAWFSKRNLKKKKNRQNRKGSKKSKNEQTNDIISDFETLDLKQAITQVLRKKEVQYSQTFLLSGVASKRTKRSEKMKCRGHDTVSILKQQPRFTERLSCCFCQASHHEGAACPHLEQNGTNPLVQRTGRKYKCSWCGSFNHFESSCPSTKEPIRDEALFLAACKASNNHRVVEGEVDSDEEEGIEEDYKDKEKNRENMEEGDVVKGCTIDEGEARKVDMEERKQTTSDTEEKVNEDTTTEQEEGRKDYIKKEKKTSRGSCESSQSVKMSCSDRKDQLMCCGICGGCSFSSHLQDSCRTSRPPASRIGEESAAGGGRRKAGPEDCGGPTDSDGSLETNELRDGCRWAESEEDNLVTLLLGRNEENLTLEKSIVATPLILEDTPETSTTGEIFGTSNNNVETSASDDNSRVFSKTCSNTKADNPDAANDTRDTHSDTHTFQPNYASFVPVCNSPLENRSTVFDGKYPENCMPGPLSPKHRENTDASNLIPKGEDLEIKIVEDRAANNKNSVINSPVKHDNSFNPSNSSPQDIFNNEIDNIADVILSVWNSYNPQLKPRSEQDSLCSDNSNQVSLPKMDPMLPQCENHHLSGDTIIGSEQNIFESGGLYKNVTIEATPSVAFEPINGKSSLRVHSDEALIMSSEIVLEVVSAVLLVCRVNLTEERIKENVDSPSLDETNVLDGRKKVTLITLGEGDDDDHGVDEEKYKRPDPEVFHHKELRTDKTTQSPITKRMHEEIVSVMQGKTDLIRTQLITQDDLFTLTGLNWLSDQVVETYLTMVAERSMTKEYRAKQLPRIHCMSTYFFRNLAARGYTSVARCTKDVDLFSYDLILVPVLKRKHWALVTVDFRTGLQDSLVRHGKKIFSDTPVLDSIVAYLQLEKDRICQEAKRDSDLQEPLKSRALSDLNLSQFSLHSLPCPQQENCPDSGVFVCQVVEYLSRGKPLNFGQRDVPYFRRKMTWELIKNRIMDEWPN